MRNGFGCTVIAFTLCLGTLTATAETTTRGVGRGGTNATGQTAKTWDEIYSGHHALVIGINAYQNMKDLEGAVRDAKAVGKLLEARNFEVLYLLDKDATRKRIYAELKALNRRLKKNDRAVVYFAGHGVPEVLRNKKHGYLMPHDGDPKNQEETGIEMKKVSDRISDMPAKHKLLITDACYSGLSLPAGTRSDSTLSEVPEDILHDSQEPMMLTLTAGSDEQEVTDDYEGHGLFTYFVIQGLRGKAAQPGKTYISSLDLVRYVTQNVKSVARSEFNREQNPKHHPDGDGDMYFRTNAQLKSSRLDKLAIENNFTALKTAFEEKRASGTDVSAELNQLKTFVAQNPTPDRRRYLAGASKAAGQLCEARSHFRASTRGVKTTDLGVVSIDQAYEADCVSVAPSLEPNTNQKAAAYYAEGLGHYNERNFTDAVEAFMRAKAHSPKSALIHKALGAAHDRAQDFEASIQAYQAYLATELPQTEKDYIDGELRYLREAVAKTYPTVHFESPLSGVYVKKGQEQFGSTPLSKKLRPGKHSLVYYKSGYESQQANVNIQGAQTIRIQLNKLPEPTNWRRVSAWASAGTGVLALGLGGLFMSQAADTADQAGAVSPATRFDGTYDRLQSDHQSQQTASVVSFSVGAVLVATGLTLWLLDGGDKNQEATGYREGASGVVWTF